MRNLLLVGVTVLALASCEKYDDSGITNDLSTLQVENAKLKAALAAIELTPGADGADGVDGSDGVQGDTGATGIAGVDGESITIVSIETSAEGSLVLFSDGSELFVENGTDGTNGANGADGSDGSDGDDGSDGQDAAPIDTDGDGFSDSDENLLLAAGFLDNVSDWSKFIGDNDYIITPIDGGGFSIDEENNGIYLEFDTVYQAIAYVADQV